MTDLSPSPRQPSHTFKVAVCGQSGVGKTSLLRRASTNEFREHEIATIGMMIYNRDVELAERELGTVRLSFYDYPGQERFRSMAPSHWRGSHVVIFVYDLCDQSSYTAMASWLAEAVPSARRGNEDYDPYVIVVGNKLDCEHDKRQVPRDAVSDVCATHGYCFMEVSARQNTNIDAMLQQIATSLLARVHGTDAAASDAQQQQQQWRNQSPRTAHFRLSKAHASQSLHGQTVELRIDAPPTRPTAALATTATCAC